MTSVVKSISRKRTSAVDYISPLTDNASDSSTDISCDHKVYSSIADHGDLGKGEKLHFIKTPSSSSSSTATFSSSVGKRERAASISLPRCRSRNPRVDVLASDEANVAKLLAEMSGYQIDLSSPMAKMQGKKSSSKLSNGKGALASEDASSESCSLASVPLIRTNSSVSIGNVLVSLGRSRSNSAEVFSGFSDLMERGEIRPRADSVGQIGIYSLAQRKAKIIKYVEKRKKRVWSKKIKYDVRKNFADSRVRVKGRFVRKEDETTGEKMITASKKAADEGPVKGLNVPNDDIDDNDFEDV